MTDTTWVLRETVASTPKRPIYFHTMTSIGPKGTANLAEAARFASEQDARSCPAMFHTWSCYEPECVAKGGET